MSGQKPRRLLCGRRQQRPLQRLLQRQKSACMRHTAASAPLLPAFLRTPHSAQATSSLHHVSMLFT